MSRIGYITSDIRQSVVFRLLVKRDSRKAALNIVFILTWLDSE